MFEVNDRVKCLINTTRYYPGPNYLGEFGTVVARSNKGCQVLFDRDRVEGDITTGQNFALAYWFHNYQLEREETAD